jgi:cysteinyl-tRNA synthetase
MEFKVYDSLTKQTMVLKSSSGDKHLKWYTCGPTVYDSAHLGHARTFLTFDIIRRILEHDGYDINYVMNITDIDDKIINKVSQIDGLTDENYKEYFMKFVKDMENQFMTDMDNLNIMRPTVVTRVTEYIDKMIKYIEKLEDDGFAYESNGSVYFDSKTYADKGFEVEPLLKMNNNNSLDDPESQLFTTDKKHQNDFVLWKKSKGKEISFDSKWSKGRVGWHLECSVMATDILGSEIDIHSGGIDLIFPHHQNECIQSNAYSNDPNYKWVNYFLHSGHLNIAGLKMSKSLKNFVSIKNYLENIGTSQQLRLLFLTHKWNKSLDYNEDTIDSVKQLDKRLTGFIDHLNFILNEDIRYVQNDETIDALFGQMIEDLKINIHSALHDNFDTPLVMKHLLNSVSETYKYMDTSFDPKLVHTYQQYLLEIFDMFGLNYSIANNDIKDMNKFIKLGVNLREDIRTIVMKHKKNIPEETLKDLFKTLDDFRNVKLVDLGIILEDRPDKKTKYVFKN